MTNNDLLPANVDRATAVSLVRAQRQWTEQLAAGSRAGEPSTTQQLQQFTRLAQELVARFGNDAWREAVAD